MQQVFSGASVSDLIRGRTYLMMALGGSRVANDCGVLIIN